MSKFKDILRILYYVFERPEDILHMIQGQTIFVNRVGGGVTEVHNVDRIINSGHLFIGKKSYIGRNADIWIHDNKFSQGEFTPIDKGERIMGQVLIGNNVRIGSHLKIDCYGRVEIEDDCLLASDILIMDTNHGKDIKSKSYVYTKREIKSVRIGKGCWIGDRVCILPGTNIGQRCIIGTNAVVTGEIPDYSIAVGIPARVIKRYNKQTKQWEKV